MQPNTEEYKVTTVYLLSDGKKENILISRESSTLEEIKQKQLVIADVNRKEEEG